MHAELSIRPARAGDVEVAAAIYLESRAAAGPAFPPTIHSSAEVVAYVAAVVLPTKQPWLAVLDGLPVGLLVLDSDDVYWLHVRPTAQDHGVGSALLAHAQSLRPGGLALWTYASNARARRFYERRGFVAVRETDGADNEDKAPDVRYAWGSHPECRTELRPAPTADS